MLINVADAAPAHQVNADAAKPPSCWLKKSFAPSPRAPVCRELYFINLRRHPFAVVLFAAGLAAIAEPCASNASLVTKAWHRSSSSACSASEEGRLCPFQPFLRIKYA